MNDVQLSSMVNTFTEDNKNVSCGTYALAEPNPRAPQANQPVKTQEPVSKNAPCQVPQYPQVVYLPQQPSLAKPEKVTVRQTCHQVVLRSVTHFWYLVYICLLLFGIYTYRLPVYNDNLRLQIELAKVKMREEEIRSQARVKEAEIHRDLTVDVEKLKLANEHIRKMKSLSISQELAEKFLESNMEVMEKSSGIFNKQTTTQKRTYLEVSEAAAFASMLGGYSEWERITEHVSQKLITDKPANKSEDEEEGVDIIDEEL